MLVGISGDDGAMDSSRVGNVAPITVKLLRGDISLAIVELLIEEAPAFRFGMSFHFNRDDEPCSNHD